MKENINKLRRKLFECSEEELKEYDNRGEEE